MQAVQVVEQFWALMSSNDFKAVGAVLSDDFVLQWPQSGERGRANFAQGMNEEYPAHGKWIFTIHRLFGHGQEVVSNVSITDSVQQVRAISFFTVAGGLITPLVEYWPDAFEAPAHRSHLVKEFNS